MFSIGELKFMVELKKKNFIVNKRHSTTFFTVNIDLKIADGQNKRKVKLVCMVLSNYFYVCRFTII